MAKKKKKRKREEKKLLALKYRPKKRPCIFCKDPNQKIDTVHPDNLRRYLTEKGKILPARMTGNCAKHQRELSRAVRRARVLAFLPFSQ